MRCTERCSTIALVNTVSRRMFLRGGTASIALPMLESLSSAPLRGAWNEDEGVRRLVCAGTYLGFHQPSFFPVNTGNDYESSTVLQPIDSFRDRFTVFSGLDHRGRNGHQGWKAWMSGSASGNISLDQLVAAQVGDTTRFESLQLTCGNPPEEARISFTRDGIAIPMIGRPSVLYRLLFHSDADHDRTRYLLSSNRSVLDGVTREARALERAATPSDRAKLGEYFASIRAVEKSLRKQIEWLDRPLPEVSYPLPEFDPVTPDLALECESIMYDLLALALTTDSTRVATFLVPGWSQVFTIGGRKLSAGYHGLSHHGNDPGRIADYNLVGIEHVTRFGTFLRKLESATDTTGRSLLDSTAVIFGSGMGNANTHDNSNLPTLLAGGGFRHGSHHRIKRDGTGPRLFGDLFLTILQRMGIEADEFAGARSNLDELLV